MKQLVYTRAKPTKIGVYFFLRKDHEAQVGEVVWRDNEGGDVVAWIDCQVHELADIDYFAGPIEPPYMPEVN